MSAKHDLQHSIMNVTQHNRDGSYNTQVDRQRILNQIAAELTSGGYKLRHIQALKQKHVRYLNERNRSYNPTYRCLFPRVKFSSCLINLITGDFYGFKKYG